jgi:hypothetical protein
MQPLLRLQAIARLRETAGMRVEYARASRGELAEALWSVMSPQFGARCPVNLFQLGSGDDHKARSFCWTKHQGE